MKIRWTDIISGLLMGYKVHGLQWAFCHFLTVDFYFRYGLNLLYTPFLTVQEQRSHSLIFFEL